jgi:hypothetical protein
VVAVLAPIYSTLGKCDALNRVQLREVSALDSGYNAADPSLVSVTKLHVAHCSGASSQLSMSNDNAELQMKP